MLACDGIKKEEEDTELVVKKEVVSDDEEGEDDGVTVKNEVVSDNEDEDRDYEPEIESISKCEIYNSQRYCAYCFEVSPRYDMVIVPKNVVKKQKWIDSLGPQFEEYILHHETSPVICKKHFNVTHFERSGKRRNRSIPHRDEQYEGRKFEDYDVSKIVVCCAYCLKFKYILNMKLIVTNHVAKGIWFRKLGGRFRERVESGNYPYICNSHFPRIMYERKHQLIHFAAPLKLDEVMYLRAVNCAYCYILKHVDETMPVPIGTDREKWVAQLGTRFETNLAIMKSPSICKSHFYNYDEVVASGGVVIPVPDEYIVHLETIQQLSTTDDVEMDTGPQKFQKEYLTSLESIQKQLIANNVQVDITGSTVAENCGLTFALTELLVSSDSTKPPFPSLQKLGHNNTKSEEENRKNSYGVKHAPKSYYYAFKKSSSQNRSLTCRSVSRPLTMHITNKCLYCHNSNYPTTYYHKIFEFEKQIWDEYSKVFGLQFKFRLKNVEFIDMPENGDYYKLCRRHFDFRGEAVPDENSHYSVDELLDHDYADYNNQKIKITSLE